MNKRKQAKGKKKKIKKQNKNYTAEEKKCTKIKIMARTLTPKENGRVTETQNDYKFADFLFIHIQGYVFSLLSIFRFLRFHRTMM